MLEEVVERHPAHHIGDELLFDYATGATSEAQGLIIATHLALCPLCRDRLTEIEAIGGGVLDSLTPAELTSDAMDAVWAEIDAIGYDVAPRGADDLTPGVHRAIAEHKQGRSAQSRTVQSRATVSGATGATADVQWPLIPRPLRDYLGGGLETVAWRRVIRGLDEAVIPTSDPAAKTKLLRIRAGTAMPRHTHAGNELTLVLAGGFSDGAAHYLRGDLAETDDAVDHQPVADTDGDCVCLTVVDAPLRLTGRVGRLFNPFLRF